MVRKEPAPFVAFDLEIARELNTAVPTRRQLPLGVTIAAAQFPDGQVKHWHGGTSAKPSPQMTAADCCRLVTELGKIVASGSQLVTWNGAGFDFLVLAAESQMWTECARLALGHVDLMFQFFCTQGYPVSLESVAQPLGLGKTTGMTGVEAPAAWQRGEYDRVREYVQGDVDVLAQVFRATCRNRRLSWVTRRGQTKRCPISQPLPVKESLELPLPDTSWMDRPRSREDSCGWIFEHI